MEYGGGLRFLMEEIQYIALSLMGLVYVAKVIWLLRKQTVSDKAVLRGSPRKGAIVSLGNIFMPWAMESTRVHWFFYVEFVLFHVGVAFTILSTFLIPFKLITPGDPFALGVMVLMVLAFVVGVRRLLRRLIRPEMRMISSMDDYFAIIILDLFFLSGIWAMATGQTVALYIFFAMTTFFLLYVPFSKISHYITYPFSRWYYGTHFGGRGVMNRLVKSSE